MSGVNECVIDWVRGDTHAGVTAHGKSRLKGRIEKLAAEYPDDVQIIARNEDGSIFAHVPVKWIKVSPTRKVSEAQRQAAGERLNAYWKNQKNSEDDDMEFDDEDGDEEE